MIINVQSPTNRAMKEQQSQRSPTLFIVLTPPKMFCGNALGNFMRQELRSTCARYDIDGLDGATDLSAIAQSSCAVDAVETIILRTLNIYCDLGTSAHAQRLASLAAETALRLCLSQVEQLQIRLAALLHDIGKVDIPDCILHKPGPLNEDERWFMRLHPEIGQEMLLLAGGIFVHLAPIVVAHHESWDGSGYPAGLQGETIPLLARILAVVDSYDAMTSPRTYCNLLTSQEACQELQQCAGRRYDPHVVAAFLAVLDERNVQTPTCSPVLPFTAYRLSNILPAYQDCVNQKCLYAASV